MLRRIVDDSKLPDAPLVQLRQEAIRVMVQHGLMQRKQRLHCKFMGVHPSNRYGDGIAPCKVHTLLVGIFTNCFDKEELDKPTAIELPPRGNARRGPMLRFNRRQTEGSSGRLPNYENGGEDIKALTVTCGHTTQTFRCVLYGVPFNHAVLAPDGHLSLDIMRMKQPPYAEAVESGIDYDLIAWEVEEIVPDIGDLFQEAGNSKNWLMRGNSRLECMLKMHASSKNLLAELGPTPTPHELDLVWERVLAQAKRGSPPYAVELEDLLITVRHLSGSVDQPKK